MKPVLTVEGKEVEVYALYYRDSKIQSVTVVDENGTSKVYHDINEDTQYYVEKPLQIDFKKNLKWVGRYDELYQTLDKAINDKATELQDLAIEHIETQQPFVPSDLQQKYLLKQREQMGLMDAQDIVHEFMQDDADLTGGEEVELLT
ncbi:MAG: hypothetical protein ABTA23_08065 [Solibacillus sp.]